MSETQKRKTKVTLKLPWDLESEILSRVPHTSVKRLQLSCKRWYALFKDPRFIKKHLDKATTQMVLKQDDSVYSFSFDFHGVHTRYDQFITITGILSSQKNSEAVEISKIFHCEGLLLCTTKDNRLVVWNPCTGQTRWIQSRLPSNGYAMYDKYFLGYGNTNKSCDSFKILRFAYYYHQRCKLEIYEFNSDSWRAFHDINRGILSSLGVSLKGNTYWLGSDDDVDSKGNTYCLDSDDDDDDLFNLILRFDFTTERFERLSLPFQSDLGGVISRWVLSVVREEKIALLVEKSNHYGLSEMKIWVTNTKADEAKDLSWSVFLVLDFTKITEGMTTVISFLVDEDNKRVMCCHQEYVDEQERTIVYVAGEDIYKPVYGEFRKNHYDMKRRRPSPLLLSYVPSLVQIPAKQGNENGD